MIHGLRFVNPNGLQKMNWIDVHEGFAPAFAPDEVVGEEAAEHGPQGFALLALEHQMHPGFSPDHGNYSWRGAQEFDGVWGQL